MHKTKQTNKNSSMNSEKVPGDMDAGKWWYAGTGGCSSGQSVCPRCHNLKSQASCASFAAFGEVVGNHHEGPVAQKSDTGLTRDILAILDQDICDLVAQRKDRLRATDYAINYHEDLF